MSPNIRSFGVDVCTSVSLNDACRAGANASLPSTLQEERHGRANTRKIWAMGHGVASAAVPVDDKDAAAVKQGYDQRAA